MKAPELVPPVPTEQAASQVSRNRPHVMCCFAANDLPHDKDRQQLFHPPIAPVASGDDRQGELPSVAKELPSVASEQTAESDDNLGRLLRGRDGDEECEKTQVAQLVIRHLTPHYKLGRFLDKVCGAVVCGDGGVSGCSDCVSQSLLE